jgi:hypothetical protein
MVIALERLSLIDSPHRFFKVPKPLGYMLLAAPFVDNKHSHAPFQRCHC